MTQDKVAEVIADSLGLNASQVKDEMSLDELGCDQLDSVELVCDLEEEFGITIEPDEWPEEDLEHFSVKKVRELIQKKLEEKK